MSYTSDQPPHLHTGFTPNSELPPNLPSGVGHGHGHGHANGSSPFGEPPGSASSASGIGMGLESEFANMGFGGNSSGPGMDWIEGGEEGDVLGTGRLSSRAQQQAQHVSASGIGSGFGLTGPHTDEGSSSNPITPSTGTTVIPASTATRASGAAHGPGVQSVENRSRYSDEMGTSSARTRDRAVRDGAQTGARSSIGESSTVIGEEGDEPVDHVDVDRANVNVNMNGHGGVNGAGLNGIPTNEGDDDPSIYGIPPGGSGTEGGRKSMDLLAGGGGGGGGGPSRPGASAPSGGAGRQDSSSQSQSGPPIGFDEGVLRALCDLDCALPLVTERIKQGVASCKQMSAFFRSRAELEEKYARGMNDLVRMSGETYSRSGCKAGSFVDAFHGALRIHDTLSQNRLRFAQRLLETSDELATLAKEGERQRKMHKEAGLRFERAVQESEILMEKAKGRFDATAEELERILIAKEGEGGKDAGASGRTKGKGLKSSIFKGGKNPAQMQRQEDEVRSRMSVASDVFRRTVQDTQTTRQEYFVLQLPKILRLLKETSDEIDNGTQYHLTRYAFMFESTVSADGNALLPAVPDDVDPGLKAVFEAIDNRNDFKTYMQNFAVLRGGGKNARRDTFDESFNPTLPPHVQQAQQQYTPPSATTGLPTEQATPTAAPSAQQPQAIPSHGTFGVDLAGQMARDGIEVPKVIIKCAEAIEAYGLESTGIYRLSGTTSRVQALKAALDRDVDAVDVMTEEWSGDINVIASVLKQWFRELPEPLLTHHLYQAFIDAARFDNDRLRHIRLHEKVNELPDPNYATLKFFMGHLDRVRRKESFNQMSVSNLSIVFGPTLLGAPDSLGAMNLEHMSFQCRAIETILDRYKEIFVEEDEAAT